MTRINTNVSSLTAQKTLARTNSQLQTSLTRLSTGLRINVGKDDPAGLIASETLRSDIVSVQRAVTNSERANQMIATADSALGQVSSLLNDIRGLVTEAANDGAMSADQLAANQLQIDSSLEAINRIAQTTQFQGKRLLDGSMDFVTTAGSISSIADLQIDQANLGASGQIDVNVDIQAAATQAEITSASGAAAARTTLNFAARGVASTITTSGGAGRSLYVRALSSSADYAGVQVDFAAGATTAASYDSTQKILSVTIANGDTVGDVITAIGDTGLFEASFSHADTTETIDTSVAANLPDQITRANFVRQSLTVTANSAGSQYNNMEVSIVTKGAGAPSATYDADGNRLTIAISSAATSDLNGLETAVNSVLSGTTQLFTATHSGAGTEIIDGRGVSDRRIVGNTGGTGFLASGFSAATEANATLTFAAGKAISIGSSDASGATMIDLKAKLLGESENGVSVHFVRDAASAAATSAEYDRTNKTLKIHYYNDGAGNPDSTVKNVVDAINGTAGVKEYFQAERRTGSGADADTILQTLATSTFTTGSDSIKVTSTIAGANFNGMQINVVRKAGQGATTPVAEYKSADNVLQITVDSSATVNLTDIAEAINKVPGFNAVVSDKGAGRIFSANDEATTTANTGTTGGNTLLAATVMEIAGTDGMEVFNFGVGSSVNQIVSAINLVSDATGVAASQQGGVLSIKSSAYGSAALASVDVRSEGTGGTFKSSLSAPRANGTDVQATINGVRADADGNTMSINTATLDLKLTVAAGSSAAFEFAITGGGALFQLGPDVVSNQQARMGIISLNTARLGGSTGKLYELGSGGSAALTTSPTKAAAIVDETISKVTSLRGRLGAFQRTTLDTNISSMNDTLENLTAAESSIRDADFAAESAALTRAQILVQSGTSVLAIANQNPQNVLSLLR